VPVRGDPKGYYRELGVHRTASAEEIRIAFRERAKLVHPDQGAASAGDGRFKRLSEAYDTLKDPRRRLQYDADGLAAEQNRQRIDPEPGREPPDITARRGERPHRVTPIPPPTSLLPQPAWLAALAACVLLCGGLGVLWWQGRDALALRDAQLTDLAQRYNALVRAEQELRTRYRAQIVAAVDGMPAGGDAETARPTGQTLFSQEVPFQVGSAELDAPIEATVDAAVVGLSRALRQVPESEDWTVVVAGHAGRAVADGGVDVEAWEMSLLRIGRVIDRLVEQGLPAERIAARFQAGFAQGVEADTPVVELELVCCFR
jgi:outer membrane protein OmpA-like peptidoglycan-associated protein